MNLAPTPYVYHATVLSNYDGDTFKVVLDMGLGVSMEASCRLLGLDTPEMKSKLKAEKALAIKAKARLNELFGDGQVVLHSTKKPDLYGRILVLAYKGEVCVNEVLVKEGLALPYDGGTKTLWALAEDPATT